MVRTRRESHQRNGITDPKSLQPSFATKSAISGLIQRSKKVPARAIRCAGAVREAVRALGLDVRCGVHTGECELVGKDLAGIALHIGARVSALAGSGEILVSQTVRDLVAGSGLSFNERGKHRLKGVPDEWRLFEAVLD